VEPEESSDNVELPPGRARRALFVLALVSFTNYVDRMILPAVSQPIKLEFGLSDTQIGLLNGLAFVLLYAASGVPLARLADRTSRPLVLAGALAFWSIATATCGFVRHFWQLALARACVGIGESACQPVGYAIISDYYPANRRASAMAWFLVGNSLGVTAGFALGGWLGQMYGWRVAFVAVGVPGLLLSLAVTRLPRVRAPSRTGPAYSNQGIWQTIRVLFASRTFRWLTLQNAVYSATIFGPIAWLPSFFMRSHDLPLHVAATWTGLAIGFGMGGGMLVGGALADRLSRGGRHRPQWLGMVSVVLSGLVFLVVLQLPDASWALAVTFIALLFGSMGSPVNTTAIQNEAPPELRATAASIALLAVGIIGIGLAPLLVGVLSDSLVDTHGTTEALRIALLASLSLSLVTAALYAQVARVMRSDGLLPVAALSTAT
jgi:predicted MFS family arabinose efflux permease